MHIAFTFEFNKRKYISVDRLLKGKATIFRLIPVITGLSYKEIPETDAPAYLLILNFLQTGL